MNIKVCFPEKRHFTDIYFDLFHGLRDETLTVYCSRCIVDTVRRTIQNTTRAVISVTMATLVVLSVCLSRFIIIKVLATMTTLNVHVQNLTSSVCSF